MDENCDIPTILRGVRRAESRVAKARVALIIADAARCGAAAELESLHRVSLCEAPRETPK